MKFQTVRKVPGPGCDMDKILIDRHPVPSPVGNEILAGNRQVGCRLAGRACQVANSVNAFIYWKGSDIAKGVGVFTV